MGFDVTQMKSAMLEGFRNLTKNGEITAQDVAKKILGGYEVGRLTSIFEKAANSDGNASLSEFEFEQAISTAEFLDIVRENTRKQQELFMKAKDPSQPDPTRPQRKADAHEVDEVEQTPGTPRDHVVAEKGEFFANEIWDPMKKLADEALKYMQEHNGTTEGFTFSGFPHGVKLLQLAPSMSYMNASNDTVSIKDGQPQTTRNVDSVQAIVIFEYQGETYRLFSDQSVDDATPWGNPSYNE